MQWASNQSKVAIQTIPGQTECRNMNNTKCVHWHHAIKQSLTKLHSWNMIQDDKWESWFIFWVSRLEGRRKWMNHSTWNATAEPTTSWISLPIMASSVITHKIRATGFLYSYRQTCARCLPVTTPSRAKLKVQRESKYKINYGIVCHVNQSNLPMSV